MIKILSLVTIALGFLSACSHAPVNVSSKNLKSTTKTTTKFSNGMTRIAPNIFVDTEMSATQRKQFLQTVKQSKVEINKFFGGMKSTPKIYACSTNKCFKKFGGVPAIAKTINDDTVLLSSKGLDKTTLTHELAHAEFHKRLGTPHLWHKVPMWFDEGLAVLACKDPKYAKPVPTMSLNKLSSHDQWLDAVRNKKPVYNIARQAMEAWYKGVGTKGLLDVIERLKKGEDLSFAKITNSVHQYSKL